MVYIRVHPFQIQSIGPVQFPAFSHESPPVPHKATVASIGLPHPMVNHFVDDNGAEGIFGPVHIPGDPDPSVNRAAGISMVGVHSQCPASIQHAAFTALQPAREISRIILREETLQELLADVSFY